MNVEAVGSISATVRANASANQNVAAQAATQTSAASSATTTTPVDPTTGEPKPLRYPWISRLTLELEKNAQHSSPFEATKITGETLNKLA